MLPVHYIAPSTTIRTHTAVITTLVKHSRCIFLFEKTLIYNFISF